MKKLLLLLLLALTTHISIASHLAGGEIWYEYAGDSVHPYRYDVYLIVYRDVSGVNMCPAYCPASICIQSSCFPDQQVTAYLLPFSLNSGSDTIAGSYPGSIKTPFLSDCINKQAPSLINTEAYRFHTQVDLPGPCSDFSFTYYSSARNPSDNLVASTGKNLFLRAMLNNSLGQNSSPQFQYPAIKAFCLGKTTHWSHSCVDQDGDSLYYSLEIPIGGSCSSPSILLSYAPGYHQSQPISSSTPFLFDYHTGTLTFTPSQIEVVTFKIDVKEYRYIPTYNTSILIGSVSRDVQVPIVSSSNCGVTPVNWLSNSNTTGGANSQFSCGDSSISVKFDVNILNSTVAADGSDFALLNSQGKLVPIVGASPSAKYANNPYCKELDLKLHQPLYYNDSLYLYVRPGSDLNTLITTCGYEVTAGDSLHLEVINCSTSIGIEDNSIPSISIFPNPSSYFFTIVGTSSLIGSKLMLFDIAGKVVMRKTLQSDQSRIDVSRLPKGIYRIQINTDNWTQTLQLEKL